MDLYGSLFAVPIPPFQIRLSTRMNKCQMLWRVNCQKTRASSHATLRWMTWRVFGFDGLGSGLVSADRDSHHHPST